MAIIVKGGLEGLSIRSTKYPQNCGFVDILLVEYSGERLCRCLNFLYFCPEVFSTGMGYYLHTDFQLQSGQSTGGSVGLSGGGVQAACAPMKKMKMQADCALK